VREQLVGADALVLAHLLLYRLDRSDQFLKLLCQACVVDVSDGVDGVKEVRRVERSEGIGDGIKRSLSRVAIRAKRVAALAALNAGQIDDAVVQWLEPLHPRLEKMAADRGGRSSSWTR